MSWNANRLVLTNRLKIGSATVQNTYMLHCQCVKNECVSTTLLIIINNEWNGANVVLSATLTISCVISTVLFYNSVLSLLCICSNMCELPMKWLINSAALLYVSSPRNALKNYYCRRYQLRSWRKLRCCGSFRLHTALTTKDMICQTTTGI